MPSFTFAFLHAAIIAPQSATFVAIGVSADQGITARDHEAAERDEAQEVAPGMVGVHFSLTITAVAAGTFTVNCRSFAGFDNAVQAPFQLASFLISPPPSVTPVFNDV